MLKLPNCPQKLPDRLTTLAENLAHAWVDSDVRPKLKTEVATRWDAIINEWSSADDMPLLIRRHRSNRGSKIVHMTGRFLVPVDNTPAHWSFNNAISRIKVDLGLIRGLFANDEFPIAMALKKVEKSTAFYKCISRADRELNAKGWKLSHIAQVGLKGRTPLEEFPIEDLKTHFIRLMSPSNMFLVPKIWSGLGELPEMTKAMRMENEKLNES